jgi:hypothetical protein
MSDQSNMSPPLEGTDEMNIWELKRSFGIGFFENKGSNSDFKVG